MHGFVICGFLRIGHIYFLYQHLCDKVRTLLEQQNLENVVPLSGIFSSSIIAKKISELSDLCDACMDEHQKKMLVRQNLQLQKYLSKAMEYEEKGTDLRAGSESVLQNGSRCDRNVSERGLLFRSQQQPACGI